MPFPHATGVPSTAASAVPTAVDLARWTAGSFFGLLVAAAVLLAWRRLAGALCAPLNSTVLATIGLIVVTAAGGVRWQWARGRVGQIANLPEQPPMRNRSEQRQVGNLPHILLSAAVLLLGLSLSLPNTPLAGLSIFWMLIGIGEGWAWRRAAWRTPRSPSAAVAPRDAPQLRIVGDESPLRTAADEAPPEEVSQQLTRSQTADGADELAGWLRMSFAAGQRTGSLHVAFCPPFAQTPEVSFEQTDGPEARIKTAQLLPYGVRLDLKLSAVPAAPGSILLQFAARSERPDSGKDV